MERAWKDDINRIIYSKITNFDLRGFRNTIGCDISISILIVLVRYVPCYEMSWIVYKEQFYEEVFLQWC